MAKLHFSTYAILLLVVCTFSVVNVQCNIKDQKLVVSMPAGDPPYDGTNW